MILKRVGTILQTQYKGTKVDIHIDKSCFVISLDKNSTGNQDLYSIVQRVANPRKMITRLKTAIRKEVQLLLSKRGKKDNNQ